jgi:hypothetical protein
MATSATPAPAGQPEAPKKSLLDRVVGTTPVVLTVLATVLAGLSSRELTQAHLVRSLATQQQSKADDEWSFFQAKRTRGTVVEMAGDSGDAPVASDRIDAGQLEEATARTAEDLARARREADKLLAAVDSAKGELGAAAGPLRTAVEKLVARARDRAAKADEARGKLGRTLSQPEIREAFDYLDGDKVPEVEKRPIEDENLRKAIAALEARQPEGELEGTVRQIKPEVLQKAIDNAEANVRDFDARAKPVGKSLEQLGKLIARQAALVSPVMRAAREVRAALADVPFGDRQGLNEVRTAAAGLDRTVTALGTRSEEVGRDFRSAERAYRARRYDREANYNKDVALLYEVLVRQLGQVSEGHRHKSANLFYAMLAAQGGVTVATLALAVRYKSLLWTLATIAGLSALLFGSYVFVNL